MSTKRETPQDPRPRRALLAAAVCLLTVVSLLLPVRAAAINQGGGGGGNQTTSSAGGYTILGDDPRGSDQLSLCTLGFNVVKDNTYYLLTAGHCATENHSRWYRLDHYSKDRKSAFLGSYLGWSSLVSVTPDGDFALISYTSTTPVTKYGSVFIGQGKYADMTRSGPASTGEAGCFTGAVSGHHCGHVTSACKNAGNIFGAGKIRCAIETDICTKEGDSGGPLYSGTVGLGILRGSSPRIFGLGKCHSYFTPLTYVLSHAGHTRIY